MAQYKVTVEGGSYMVTYTATPQEHTTFLEDLKVLKAYALEVSKAMGMGTDPSITIEEVVNA